MPKTDGPSAIHLGDDGVLRRMEITIPKLSRREDRHREAAWEVRDAIPLSSQQIRRWVDTIGPRYPEHSARHFNELYADVDGRDVDPDSQINPHPSLLLAPLGSIAEVRKASLNRRNNEDRTDTVSLTKRYADCKSDDDCVFGGRCVFTDKQVTGRCVIHGQEQPAQGQQQPAQGQQPPSQSQQGGYGWGMNFHGGHGQFGGSGGGAGVSGYRG